MKDSWSNCNIHVPRWKEYTLKFFFPYTTCCNLTSYSAGKMVLFHAYTKYDIAWCQLSPFSFTIARFRLLFLLLIPTYLIHQSQATLSEEAITAMPKYTSIQRSIH